MPSSLPNSEIHHPGERRLPLQPPSPSLTPADRERRAFQAQYSVSDLKTVAANPNIAGYPFQLEALRRVTEGLSQGQRAFLLVMATGTGKTRTAVALVDLLMRAKWVQRVLFLADRRELVRQAIGDFKAYLPREPWARVEGGQVDHQAFIHVATYASMMQAYPKLSSGYYDLIIADESHRSIYNHYRVLLEYFDALQLGLTATPTDYIDHNTFELFRCPDGLPTFYYPYETAVREGYLVGYKVFEAQTTFQLEGIKAGQLPPDLLRQLEECGIEPNELDFEGSELERRVTNTGTTDALVNEFMTRCRRDASGTLPAKAIIFAVSHHHAREIWESFRRLYPTLHRKGLVEVIDSYVEHSERLLDNFKRREMPRVAISVDMLDTGVDIPAVQTLVFAKPVFSHVKFWQMIGRGTRRWTNPLTDDAKRDFLIIDYWNNFAYFNLHPEGEDSSPTEALPTRLFRLRLEKLLLLRGLGHDEDKDEAVTCLQTMLASLPSENIHIQPHLALLRTLAEPVSWQQLDNERLGDLQYVVAPLLRFLPDVVWPIMLFEVQTERLALALLQGATEQITDLRTTIIEALQLLPTEVREVQAEADNYYWIQSKDFWETLTYQRVMLLQRLFSPLMVLGQRAPSAALIHLNLPDEIAHRRWVVYGPGGEGAFAEHYRAQVEAHLRTLVEDLPSLQRLRRGEPLSEQELRDLATVLDQADLFITEKVLCDVLEQPGAALVELLRHLLGLGRLPGRAERVRSAFDEFAQNHPRLTSTQLAFLRMLRTAALRQSPVTVNDLEQPPYSQIGMAHQLFSSDELETLLALTNAHAA